MSSVEALVGGEESLLLSFQDSAPAPSLAAHAANRLMFGPRPGDVAAIEAMGYDAFLAQQLNPFALDDSASDARVVANPVNTLFESPQQLYDRRNMSWEEAIEPVMQTRWATWTRMIYSRRQLWERMVEFWHNHFSVYCFDFTVRSMWTWWDSIFRTHAFGNFRNLLSETAKNPCMLYYLDNYISTDGGPNENYARELFELHTLGQENYQVTNGYIDTDVYESSRCFTGWTYERGNSNALRGTFKYVHDDHDRFIKFVLGSMFLNDQPPLKDGEDVLDIIAAHPGTARHIARKLCQRFIGPGYSQSIVQSTADVFLTNRFAPGQIALTLHHLLSSQEFKDTRMNRFKRPIDWTVSAMRATEMQYTTNSQLMYLYDPMGMPMFEWATPDGPPDDIESWATSNNLLQRWNWAFRIASRWYTSSGIQFPTQGMLPAGVDSPQEIAQFLVDRLLQRPISTVSMNSLIEFIADGRSWTLALPTQDLESRGRYGLALTLMMPEFMMC